VCGSPDHWAKKCPNRKEKLNLSRRIRTWRPTLEMELVGTVIYIMFFQCFNLPLGNLILVQMFILMLFYFFLQGCMGFIRDDEE
jgi:hypothetical protein